MSISFEADYHDVHYLYRNHEANFGDAQSSAPSRQKSHSRPLTLGAPNQVERKRFKQHQRLDQGKKSTHNWRDKRSSINLPSATQKMHPVLGNAFAFLCGLLVATVVIALIQSVGHRIYPVANPVAPYSFHHIMSLPLGAFLFVELSYIVGSVLGGYAAAKIASSHKIHLAITLGVLLTLFGVQNLTVIPHPLWFAILSTCTYIPAAYFGATQVVSEETFV